MSHDVQIVKIGPSIFCTTDPFTQPQKSYALQCFNRPDSPKKCSFPRGHLHTM